MLLLNEMGGGEELGRLFNYELQLTSLDANIDLNQLLGKPMSVGLQLADGGERYFHGIVARCSQNIDQGQFASYQATLRPWLWLLSRTSDCRIFQNLSIPQIIKQVFRDLGFPTSKTPSAGHIASGSTACSTARPASISSAG